jgi:hypothetical protein
LGDGHRSWCGAFWAASGPDSGSQAAQMAILDRSRPSLDKPTPALLAGELSGHTAEIPAPAVVRVRRLVVVALFGRAAARMGRPATCRRGSGYALAERRLPPLPSMASNGPPDSRGAERRR